jgi:hypothetical protein
MKWLSQAQLRMNPVGEIVKVWHEPCDVPHHQLVVGIVDEKVCKIHRYLEQVRTT